MYIAAIEDGDYKDEKIGCKWMTRLKRKVGFSVLTKLWISNAFCRLGQCLWI